MNKKVWKIKGDDNSYSDQEIIALIKSGRLDGEDALLCKELDTYIKIKDSIYEYYLRREK